MKKIDSEKVLIIVDMQNDFISGSLANAEAEKIVDPICDYIKSFEGEIICTRDTHDTGYLKTTEGKYLPVEHCILDTAGWCIEDRIQKALRDKKVTYVNKAYFGTLRWTNSDMYGITIQNKDIYICGTCTDICVISNALILKAAYPDSKITVLGNLCAGVTPEKHKSALEVMRSCQIEVI